MDERTQRLAHFQEHGYVIVPGMFSMDEVEALRAEMGAQIDAGGDRGDFRHFGRAPDVDGTPRLFRIDAIINKRLVNDSSLVALAHPEMLELAIALVGHDAVCWSDALLWKGPEGGAAVPMHSAHGWGDPSHPFENLVVDIYLDEANRQNGCLRVLPGSHHLSAEENRALVDRGFDNEGQVEVPMQPGDVLFHTEWMVHGSLPTGPLGSATRRIYYLAFRRAAMYAPDGAPEADRRFVAACFRRQELAIEARRGAPYAAGERPIEWAVPPEWAELTATITDAEADAVGWFGDIPQPAVAES